jgi:iron complex outermembrane receptor protein
MPHRLLAVDLTAFHNRYDNLRSQEITAGRIVVGNMVNDNSTGANVIATLQPRPWMRVTGSYTWLTHDLSLDPGSTDLYGGAFETIDPEHLARAQARVDLPRGFELDVMTMFVGELRQADARVPATPSYGEASFRLGWRLNSGFDVSLIGRDVMHHDHVEFISPTSSRVTALERALFTRLTFAF